MTCGSLFLSQSGFRLPVFLAGVTSAELLLIVLFTVVLGVLVRLGWLRRTVPIAASLLLVTGVVWFFVGLRA